MPIDRLLKIRLSIAFVVAFCLSILIVLQAPNYLNRDQETNADFFPDVVQIEDLQGKVLLVRESSNPTDPVTRELSIEEPIKHFDRVKLVDGQTIVFSLIEQSNTVNESNYKIEVIGPAEVLFEKWNWQIKKTPLLIYLELGEGGTYNVLTKGLRGEAYIIANGLMFAPESRKGKKLGPVVISLDGAPLAQSDVEVTDDTNVVANELPEKMSPDENAEQKASNFIAQRLAEQREEFIKCQSNALREGLPSKGELLIGFLIQKNGKAEEIKVLKSTVNNPSLESCTVSVVQRISFIRDDGQARAMDQLRTSFPLYFQ